MLSPIAENFDRELSHITQVACVEVVIPESRDGQITGSNRDSHSTSTRPNKQPEGVATSLMQIAEFHARQHRAETIGLSAGIENAPAQALYRKLAYKPTDIPPYSVTWNYLDQTTGEVKEDGELCYFWIRSLDESKTPLTPRSGGLREMI